MKTQSITLIIAILGVLHGPLVAMLLSRAKSRRKPPIPATYPGIRIRISNPSGVVVEVDSDELHYLGQLNGGPAWYDLIAGGDAGTTEFSTVPLKIEVKPVALVNAQATP